MTESCESTANLATSACITFNVWDVAGRIAAPSDAAGRATGIPGTRVVLLPISTHRNVMSAYRPEHQKNAQLGDLARTLPAR